MKSHVFALLITFSSSVFGNEHILKICLTGSTEKALPKYGEAFTNGVKMAVSELNQNDQKKILIKDYFHESNPLAPISSLKAMIENSCDAILGFSTGNDLLLIEPQLKKDPIFTLSIYGDPQESFKKTNYLRTMQPNAEELTDFLFANLPEKITKESKVLIVTAVDRSEMIEYNKIFKKNLKKLTNNITSINVIEQTHDISEVRTILRKNSNWDTVILLTRSLIAAEIADLIRTQNTNKKLFFLGTKYFGSSELPAFYNYLTNKEINAFFSRQNCSCDQTTEYKNFRDSYKNRYAMSPMSISSDAYEATKFILNALSLKKINRKTVINLLGSIERTYPITSLKVSKGLKISTSKKFLMKVDKSGYSQVL